MKRTGNLYGKICDMDNLMLAEQQAGKGKRGRREIVRYREALAENIAELRRELVDGTYSTGKYEVFKIYDPKERDISKLPYKDRIAHHAIMNQLEGVVVPAFTADTYSSLKGRGVHAMAEAMIKAFKDREGTKYCLQMDIRKFYPSVDHETLKALLRRKLKDKELLAALDGIIDSAPGLPIGNYLSQYLANYYLSGLDHWIKEVKRVKYYFRYADDMIVLGGNTESLHALRVEVQQYLAERLKLELKGNYQVFPVAARGVDVIGYRFYHTHTLVRKIIKLRCRKMLRTNNNPRSVASYQGWMKHGNCRNLQKKLNIMKSFKDLAVNTAETGGFIGAKIDIYSLLNKEIEVHAYKIEKSKFDKWSGMRLVLQVVVDGEKRIIFSGSTVLMETLKLIAAEHFPFKTVIRKEDRRFYFD